MSILRLIFIAVLFISLLPGGPVYISQLSSYGKVEPDCAVINGHKAPVQEIAFSPFHSGLMATGSNDSTVNSILFLQLKCTLFKEVLFVYAYFISLYNYIHNHFIYRSRFGM